MKRAINTLTIGMIMIRISSSDHSNQEWNSCSIQTADTDTMLAPIGHCIYYPSPNYTEHFQCVSENVAEYKRYQGETDCDDGDEIMSHMIRSGASGSNSLLFPNEDSTISVSCSIDCKTQCFVTEALSEGHIFPIHYHSAAIYTNDGDEMCHDTAGGYRGYGYYSTQCISDDVLEITKWSLPTCLISESLEMTMTLYSSNYVEPVSNSRFYYNCHCEGDAHSEGVPIWIIVSYALIPIILVIGCVIAYKLCVGFNNTINPYAV